MRFSLYLIIIIFSQITSANSSEKPLWEFGIFGGGLLTADYPGSDESEFRHLIFPNFYYRGKIFRSDDSEGLRARIFNTNRFKIDFSVDFNFPVDSNNSVARNGMDDVDFFFEIGPRIKFLLSEWNDGKNQLYTLLPLRKGFLTDFGYLGDAGWSLTPGIQYNRKAFGCSECYLLLRLNASFLDKKNADVFYRVGIADVTSTRQAFEGKTGFNASEIFLAYIFQIKMIQGFLGIFHSEFGGSVNAASPLLTAGSNTTTILGLGWNFWASTEKGYK